MKQRRRIRLPLGQVIPRNNHTKHIIKPRRLKRRNQGRARLVGAKPDGNTGRKKAIQRLPRAREKLRIQRRHFIMRNEARHQPVGVHRLERCCRNKALHQNLLAAADKGVHHRRLQKRLPLFRQKKVYRLCHVRQTVDQGPVKVKDNR